MENRNKIYVVGEVILDIAPAFLGGPYQDIWEYMKPGRASLVGDCKIYAGAMGNTALALKKLGGNPVLAGRIGKDWFGTIIEKMMEGQGVECRFTVDSDAQTPYSIAVSVPGLDRLFLYHPDAAWRFSESDVTDAMLREARILHYGYPMAMKRMFQNQGEESVRLLKRAKEQGAVTSMDICFIDEKEEGPHQDWNRIFKRLSPYLDIFLPSAEELLYYIDREKYRYMVKKAQGGEILENIDIEKDIAPLADRLIRWGCKILVVKCGTRGIFLKTGNTEAMGELKKVLPVNTEEWSDKTLMQNAFLIENPVSTAGAGDTTIAAFLMALTKGYSPELALKAAAATGARCVQSYDSCSNLIPLEELLGMLR